ncbi:type II toxin-antitoxin system RelE/ParE family toxin [Candidatus Falkowbacteria bacterium CG_4_9_14_3_um_filter_38_19]|uniref:Type II toxin-antitoxin system RelE/ParE family toxin n=1 Tax=Candidatus Falkowbacteria bacterium CG_4_9_14_3_um_filter_38_19 TaxID=1974559 RepID=A0A2M8AD01_9BACT|nr:MAG: type II toxin-antitoxin system RelE/ParE family toxin [Candidatus Falkowbacteria bacterium CG_4_9_14_3_um_filter_38_19]
MKINILDASLEKFIKSLEKSTIAKVLRIIDLLEKFGHNLGLPHSKKVCGQLYELRIRSAQEVRIFYIFRKSKIFLLHGFIKKSQRVPGREIRLALKKAHRFDNV